MILILSNLPRVTAAIPESPLLSDTRLVSRALGAVVQAVHAAKTHSFPADQ
jgi:hypothetical protein